MDKVSTVLPPFRLPTRRVRRKIVDHPLNAVFDAKRMNDIARRAMLEALADWTAGRGPIDALDAHLARWVTTNDALLEAVRQHRHLDASTFATTGLEAGRPDVETL